MNKTVPATKHEYDSMKKKKESRQVKWQKKQIATGNCMQCGKERNRHDYNCDLCQQKVRARNRRLKIQLPDFVKAYDSLLKRIRWAEENGSEDYLFALLDMKKIFNRINPLSKLYQINIKKKAKKKKVRCRYSKEGLQMLKCKQREGYIVGKSRDGFPRVNWNGDSPNTVCVISPKYVIEVKTK